MPLGVETYLPFPIRISPDVARAEAVHLDWPRSFGLLPSEVSARRHVQGRFPELAARFNPRAVGPELDLSTDQMSWFFLFDDLFDGDAGTSVASARALVDAVEAVLSEGDGAAVPDLTNPIVAAFADLWRRSCEGMSPQWRARAAGSWRTYLAGHVTEAANRRADVDPSREAQIAVRAETGGVRPILDLAERLGGYELPDSVWHGPDLSEMRRLAAEVVILDNDIVSVEKEERIGDHNLVLHVERSRTGTSRDQAVAEVAELLRTRTERFLELAVEFTGAGQDPDGRAARAEDRRRYVEDALTTVMRGAHDWQQHSERYRPEYLDLTTRQTTAQTTARTSVQTADVEVSA